MNKLLLFFFIGTLSINAQHHDNHEDDSHEFKHFRAAINIAHGHILTSQVADNNFIGADMARKFLQMGYGRSRRYANHKSGKKI